MPLNLVKRKSSQFKEWFMRLGFWKKLILIFTINTLIILIAMNVQMEILFAQVNSKINAISNQQTDQYISISNSLVTQSVVNSLIVGVEVYADFIVQIDSSLHFFRERKKIYKSLLSGVPVYNPPLTSQLNPTPNYRQPAIYFFSQNSTFHDQPYLDVLLSSMFGAIQQIQIRRMNIIYQSLSNPSDIFARTLPGTSDFFIPSIQTINNRFLPLTTDTIIVSGRYNDSYTQSESPNQLFALRTVQEIDGFRILLQVQIYQQTLFYFLHKIYYFPSTQIVLFKVTSQNPPSYQLINVDKFHIDLSDCLKHGVHVFVMPDGSVLNAYSIAVNQSFQIGQSPFIITQEQLILMEDTTGSFRVVLIVKQEQLSKSNNFMYTFLQKQSLTLSYLIYGWSFVILLATVGLSIVTGNYIFHNLKTLSQKLQLYTKFPNKMHKIIFQLKQLECRGIIKKLIDNIITIMEKIEDRKRSKNQVINPMIYPLNLAQKQFGIRHNLGDERRWEELKKLLMQTKQRSKNQKITLQRKSSSPEKLINLKVNSKKSR